jgi:hypothetical protein
VRWSISCRRLQAAVCPLWTRCAWAQRSSSRRSSPPPARQLGPQVVGAHPPGAAGHLADRVEGRRLVLEHDRQPDEALAPERANLDDPPVAVGAQDGEQRAGREVHACHRLAAAGDRLVGRDLDRLEQRVEARALSGRERGQDGVVDRGRRILGHACRFLRACSGGRASRRAAGHPPRETKLARSRGYPRVGLNCTTTGPPGR